jgi:diguanylate cyclase (GGDEF)-like protein/PAS domain S-box-containing protein
LNNTDFHKSLRFKLLIASVAVEFVMLALLVANSVRLIQTNLSNQGLARVEEIRPLLNAALSGPLAQRDYGTLQEILNEIQSHNGIAYLAVFDNNSKVIAANGWSANRPLPELDTELNADDGYFDTQTDITISNQKYGVLRYGLSTEFLTVAKTQLLQQSLLIAAAEIGLSIFLLALIGYWLTRHLVLLTRASEAVASGNFDAQLPATTQDEIGQLSLAFNTMSAAINNRITALNESKSKFHAIADFTYGWESWLGPDGSLIWVNPSVERITGYSVDECMEMSDFPSCLAVPEDVERVQLACKTTLQGGSKGEYFEFQLRRKNGLVIWIIVFWQPIYNAAGESQGIRTSMLDITERKESEMLLQNALTELGRSDEARRLSLLNMEQERARLVALLAAMNLGILFVNSENHVMYYNPTFLRIWMIPEDVALSGKAAEEVLNYSGNVLARPDHFSRHILSVLETHEVSDSFEITMADGRVITQLSYPVRDNEGRFIGRLWIYEDITRERQTAEQLIYLAERDALTGLYNRRKLQEELSRLLAIAERHKSRGALIFFDLDEFKYVNDTFGHRAGDTMLIRIAGEVGALVRRNEILSRLGGDEFALLMPDATEKDAEALAERVVRAIAQIPFRFEGQNFRLTTSLGIALYPEHATSTEELIAHADAAMYQAKESGKNAWRKYRNDLDTSREMLTRLSWNDRIASALENNLLRLHFQGVYHAASGNLAHLEVLVRMVDEQDHERLIMPGHFIPHAEKSGKILDLDRWVIRASIALLAKSKSIPALAVNISGRSFDEPTLPHYIAEQLQEFNVSPQRLLIELTETSAVSDLQDAERFIEALHNTGCTTCLDDFGTGFSSFAYLKHLKADVLKIDGLFIRDLPNDRDNQVFVKSIVDVARGLGKKTVAEFVENAEILVMLQSMGVDMVQGYHLDKPQEHHPAITKALNAITNIK